MEINTGTNGWLFKPWAPMYPNLKLQEGHPLSAVM